MNALFEKKVVARVVSVKHRTKFVSNLVTARKRRGLTQLELAERSGVGRIAIAMYESGKSLPPLPKFMQLCKALRTTPNRLLKA